MQAKSSHLWYQGRGERKTDLVRFKYSHIPFCILVQVLLEMVCPCNHLVLGSCWHGASCENMQR